MVELICDRVASLYILRRNCRFQCWTNWSILKVCGVHSKLNTSTVRWCWQQKTKRILVFVLQKSHSHGIQRVAKIQSIFGRARRTRVISSKCLNVVIGHKEFALVAMLPVSQSWLSRPSVQRTKNNYVFAETLREKVSMSFFFFLFYLCGCLRRIEENERLQHWIHFVSLRSVTFMLLLMPSHT